MVIPKATGMYVLIFVTAVLTVYGTMMSGHCRI
jgi:hypothetical protein